MQKFKYKAVNIKKKTFKGVYLAENEIELRNALSKQGLYLISCSIVSNKTPNAFFSVTGKVKTSEITHFCRQYSIMINAGISIVDCLQSLKEQSYSNLFKKVINLIYEDVLSGSLLSEAMKKHKKVFPEFFSSMVYVGEMSGSLDVVLTNLANYYETDSKMRTKAKSAMIYPITLILLLVAVIGVMMFLVIPIFQKNLTKMGVEMPMITQIIFNISNFFVDNFQFIFLVLVLIYVIYYVIGKTEKGKYLYDTIKIKLPLIGKVQTNLITARFARGFGILINGGIGLVESMEIIANVLGNKNVEKRFRMAIEDVRRGMSLTLALDSYNLFPQLLIQMVAVGEKSATIDEVLLKCCSYFDSQVESAYSALTAVLQPIMLLIMGVVIGVVFIGIYSPMISIMKTIG